MTFVLRILFILTVRQKLESWKSLTLLGNRSEVVTRRYMQHTIRSLQHIRFWKSLIFTINYLFHSYML